MDMKFYRGTPIAESLLHSRLPKFVRDEDALCSPGVDQGHATHLKSAEAIVCGRQRVGCRGYSVALLVVRIV